MGSRSGLYAISVAVRGWLDGAALQVRVRRLCRLGAGQWVSPEQPSELGEERWRCLRGMLRPELPGARPLAQAAQQQTGLVGWGQHHSWSRRASATGAGGPQAEQEGHCGAGWPGEASSKHLNESDGACARSGEGDGWGWCRCRGAATGVAHT